jgi:hypothetical protein
MAHFARVSNGKLWSGRKEDKSASGHVYTQFDPLLFPEVVHIAAVTELENIIHLDVAKPDLGDSQHIAVSFSPI